MIFRRRILRVVTLVIAGMLLAGLAQSYINKNVSLPQEKLPVILNESSNATSSQAGQKPSGTELGGIKNAVVYERISDGIAFHRSMGEVCTIFQETAPGLIFRSFFRWQPVPESSASVLDGYPEGYAREKAALGYTYAQLGQSIDQIRSSLPNTVIIGAVAAQRLNKTEYNDRTYQKYTETQTWNMAFDPSRWGLNMSKQAFQSKAAAITGDAYFPDITNPQYQELLLSWADKQIDLGVDGIWIDMLFAQASAIAQQTGNPEHPAVKAAYAAAVNIVDAIHNYGQVKYDKYIYVGTWWQFAELPHAAPNIDFVTASPKSNEITRGLDESNWNSIMEIVGKKLPDTPLLAFVDWNGTAAAPMGVFSQNLSPAQQKSWLTEADRFFTGKGIVFAYPVHGGTFKGNTLSFDKFGVYDSLAPEFDTYPTIKELLKNHK